MVCESAVVVCESAGWCELVVVTMVLTSCESVVLRTCSGVFSYLNYFSKAAGSPHPARGIATRRFNFKIFFF